MWGEVRELFPIHRSCVYLNNAGVSPPSVRVLEALDAYHRHHATHGAPGLMARYRDTGARIKRILGELLACPPSHIALIHNTSEGMSILAQGLEWSPGDIVLGLQREYPANVYPWWNLEARGVQYVQIPATGSPEDFPLIERAMNERVRVVSVSGVNWCTGHVADLERLGRLCFHWNAILVVDVAQSLGVVPHHPEASGVAAMAGSAWKWLMGPLGLGIFYCRPDLTSSPSRTPDGSSSPRPTSTTGSICSPRWNCSRRSAFPGSENGSWP